MYSSLLKPIQRLPFSSLGRVRIPTASCREQLLKHIRLTQNVSTISTINPLAQHLHSPVHTLRGSFCRDLCTPSEHSIAKTEAIQPASGAELVLSPPALVVTREYEWANILIGFEQGNRYTIRAAPGGSVVGYIAEENSIGKMITRNLLRTHRPFKATVFDKDQNIIFRIRRPMYLVSTSIFIESPEGETIGEVHMNWHLWRRRYNLYIDKSQFASVDSGFLALDFNMQGVDDKRIASVNKDFTGFAREIFTDARQYVLRLDPSYGLEHDQNLIMHAATVMPSTGEESDVKLNHQERAVILATAIAIDFDYFSIHSRGPGMMMMPFGSVPGGGPQPGAAGVGAGAAVGADAMSGATDAETPYEISDEEIDADPSQASSFGSDSGSTTQEHAGFEEQSANAEESPWATFEEADHGFDDTHADESAWTADDDTWGADSAGDDEGGGGLFGVIKGIFFDDD